MINKFLCEATIPSRYAPYLRGHRIDGEFEFAVPGLLAIKNSYLPHALLRLNAVVNSDSIASCAERALPTQASESIGVPPKDVP